MSNNKIIAVLDNDCDDPCEICKRDFPDLMCIDKTELFGNPDYSCFAEHTHFEKPSAELNLMPEIKAGMIVDYTYLNRSPCRKLIVLPSSASDGLLKLYDHKGGIHTDLDTKYISAIYDMGAYDYSSFFNGTMLNLNRLWKRIDTALLLEIKEKAEQLKDLEKELAELKAKAEEK